MRKEPTNDVNAAEDFFQTVTEGHIIAAALEAFGMASIDDVPHTAALTEASLLKDGKKRTEAMLVATKEVVNKYVDLSRNNFEDSVDSVQEYARDVLSLELLYLEFCDAIKEGDGLRLLRCWRYFFLIFRASHRTNYTIEAFTLLVQEKYLLSPRMAQQLIWSRTVNTRRRAGKIIPCDLHLNRQCKLALSGLGSNITDHAVQRIGRCIGRTLPILQNFDQENGVPTLSAHHTRCSSKGDIQKIVKQLSEMSEVFKHKSGRRHQNYTNFQRNIMRKVSFPTLHQWMGEQFKKTIMLILLGTQSAST